MAKKRTATTRRRPSVRVQSVKQRLATTATTTALVKRAVDPLVQVPLGDSPTSGILGVTASRFSKAEEAVMKRPVDPTRILVLPTGEPYLSHIDYTRWNNDAFGMGMWMLVPVSKPVKTDTGIGCHYHLYVRGIPRAWALGEQDYHENNKRQTWGEALESTNASGLRRCAKRLGMGLELWDKRYIDAFRRDHCIKVKVLVKEKGEEKEAWWWRRKDDPPFWQEAKAQRVDYGQAAEFRPPRQEPSTKQERHERPASRHPHENAAITDPQRRRLFTIAAKHGRTEVEIKAWLQKAYRIGSTKDLTRKDYDAVIAAIEKPGTLGGDPQAPSPEPPVRAQDIPWGGK